MLGTQSKTSILIQTTYSKIIAIAVITLSTLVVANTAAETEASPSILFVSGSHNNGQKIALLQAGAPDYGFYLLRQQAPPILKN